jgi:hypothetical protein
MLDECMSPLHGASSGCGWTEGLQLWNVAASTLNELPQGTDNGCSSSLRRGVELTTLNT